MFNKSIVLAVGLGLCSMVQAGGCRDNKVLPGVSYAAVAQGKKNEAYIAAARAQLAQQQARLNEIRVAHDEAPIDFAAESVPHLDLEALKEKIALQRRYFTYIQAGDLDAAQAVADHIRRSDARRQLAHSLLDDLLRTTVKRLPVQQEQAAAASAASVVAQDYQEDNGAGVFGATAGSTASPASNYTDEFQRSIKVDNGQQMALAVPTRTQKVIHYLNTHKKHITVATLVAIVTAYAIIKRGYMKQYALAWWQKFKQRFYRR